MVRPRSRATGGRSDDARCAKMRAGPEARHRVIETNLLSKLYGRETYALRDVSISVAKGEFVFLTGPSGAGKTTLLRLLLCQERPTSGRLSVGGRDLASLPRDQIQTYRRGVGFVFQDFKLIPGKTVFENVVFVPRILGLPVALQARRAYQVAQVGRPAAPAQRLSAGAVRRRAAAGRHCPRAGERTVVHPRRRADREPRS